MSIILWLLANKAAIGSIVGASYLVARTVIALTPTPKDDAALAKISPALKVVATVFGLDLKQGINTTPAPASASTLTPLDPPLDLPDRPDPPKRTDGEWGGRNPRDLV